MRNLLQNNLCLQFVLLLSFLVGSALPVNSFADNLYNVQIGDFLGKIVAKNYPFRQRITSQQQIMVAILRANPTAFRGGNIHFLKAVDQLLLPAENSIALIPKDEAVKTIKEHLKFFKQKKTGDFPHIPLQTPVVKSEKKVTEPKKQGEMNKKETTDTLNKKPSATEVSSSAKNPEQEAAESNNQEMTNTKKTAITLNKKPSIKEASSSAKAEELALKNNEKTIEGLVATNTNKLPQAEATIKKEITIYNWRNFLPDDVLKSFTQTTGIKVNYFTYSKEEVMYEKIKALNGRGYDLLIASITLVQKMRDNGLLQAVDHRKLKHLDYLNPKLLNRSYDPNNEFSIPYLWANVGIATNGLERMNITRWEDLWHKRWSNKLVLQGNMRHLFAVALKVNGHSINSKNPDEIKQAYRKLRKIIPNIKKLSSTFVLNDDSTNNAILMVRGSIALKLKKKQSNMQYLYPQEGSIFLMDSFVIPSNASHIENTYAFINYLLRPEIAARCVDGLNESTPNLEALKLLDKAISQDISLFPNTDILEKAEFKQDIGKIQGIYQLYWRKFKQEVKMNLQTTPIVSSK
jgi:spermidine/putrescine transport system substrate-binding protein